MNPPAFNLARIDLVSLNLVMQCARAGSISAAARHCHLSVMTASHRISRLEETLGKRLFDRHRRGLEPTLAGVVVLRAGEEIMRAVHVMTEEVTLARAMPAARKENSGRRGSRRSDGAIDTTLEGRAARPAPDRMLAAWAAAHSS